MKRHARTILAVLLIIISIGYMFGRDEITEKKYFNKADYKLPAETSVTINFNIYSVCSTFSYHHSDTTSATLTRVLGLDEKGRDREIIYNYYESRTPATSLILYDDSGRKAVTYYRIDDKRSRQTVSKTYYYYNSNGLLNRTVTFDFSRRIKKSVDKGLGRPGGCIIVEEDYEKAKSWELYSVMNYKYDSKGRLSEEFDSLDYWSSYKEVYKYDDAGKLIQKKYLDGKHVRLIEDYKYNSADYEYSRVKFEDNGERAKDHKGELEPIDTFRFETNSSGQVTQKLWIEEGRGQVTRTNMYYDNDGRMIRRESFDSADKMISFETFHYETPLVPLRKNFYFHNR